MPRLSLASPRLLAHTKGNFTHSFTSLHLLSLSLASPHMLNTLRSTASTVRPAFTYPTPIRPALTSHTTLRSSPPTVQPAFTCPPTIWPVFAFSCPASVRPEHTFHRPAAPTVRPVSLGLHRLTLARKHLLNHFGHQAPAQPQIGQPRRQFGQPSPSQPQFGQLFPAHSQFGQHQP